MEPKKIKWNDAQKKAIYLSGGTELVSAAAGSGKTAVLVERVINKIINPNNPVDIDKLLIVTYSKAAADEMKKKISKRLSELILENPQNYNLLKQQRLLSSATISTVHAFCNKLMRDNFETLGISPNLRIADDNEISLIKENAYLEVMDTFLAKNDNAFINLVDMFSKGRNDEKFKNIVFKIQNYLESQPFPEKWMEDTIALYNQTNPILSEFGKVILKHLYDILEYSYSLIKKAKEYTEKIEGFHEKYKTAIDQEKELIKNAKDEIGELIKALDDVEENALGYENIINNFDWDKICDNFVNYKRINLKGITNKCKDKHDAEIVKVLKKQVNDNVDKIKKDYFSIDSKTFARDCETLKPHISLLFSFVKEYLRLCDKIKSEKNLVTYSDLERYALKLLINEKNGELTEKAKEISELYDEILVDEYQDTNKIQDLIFKSVSKDTKNIFMVGDVKQSIYRFRKAMPEIFLNYKKDFDEYNENQPKFPAKIILNNNYRSRKGVIDGINFIFKNIMSKNVGEIDYNDEEKLNFSAEYPDVDYPSIQLDIVETNISADSEDDINKTIIEARHVANIIQKMLKDGYLVTDKDTKELRPAKYSDFCILLRTIKNKGAIYQNALLESNIPAYVKGNGGFFKAREIITITTFLKAINNPTSDIDVAGTMISPMFDFTIDDIAKLKTTYPQKSLYLAMQDEAETNKNVREFLSFFNHFRSLSVVLPVNKLILKIYEETDLISIASSMQDGADREANLMLFVKFANKCEETGNIGLSAFLRLIDLVDESGEDLPKATTLSENADVVKINSIHTSKGLEYPIVIVADISKDFNTQDLKENVMFHLDLGFACKVRENDNRIEYPTLHREAIKLKLEKEMKSEEMRIFYVALTRAKEKLILTCNTKNWHDELNKIASEIAFNEKVTPYLVFNSKSPFDWLVMCLLKHPSCKKLYKSCFDAIKNDAQNKIFNDINKNFCKDCSVKLESKDKKDFIKTALETMCDKCRAKFNNSVDDKISEKYFLEDVTILPDNNNWDVNIITSSVTQQNSVEENITTVQKTPELDARKCETLKQDLKERMNFEYPYKLATQLPAKRSVSEIAKQNNGAKILKRPDFMKKQGLTGAERGNAVHKFMQFADYKKASENPKDEITRMVELEFISKEEGEAILPQKVEAFFASNIGQRVLSADVVYRELDFFDAVSPIVAFPEMECDKSDEKIIIQGIADCVILEGDKLTIIDYKTDKVKEPHELIERYKTQLDLYKTSISKRLSKHDVSCAIYSFELDKEILL